ncbi:MAG: UDP-N-acetylmuramate dehydrogenase [Myxococcota bacterium]
MRSTLDIQTDVSLAPLTTLGLGGPARYFVRASSVETIEAALDWANDRCPALVLGGGSNLVIGDAGFDGLVLKVELRGLWETGPGALTVAAGEPWDAVVVYATERSWAGIECLAGIPGSTGATPIQNVGAYGQEVAQVIEHVEAIDRTTGSRVTIPGADCGFGYRDSRFKREPGRHLVTAVKFQLRPDGAPTIAYRELASALETVPSPTLTQVREAVLRLRRRKSMVLDPNDPDARSVGSFFTNPIVDAAAAQSLLCAAVDAGIVDTQDQVPRWLMDDGRVKFPAAWLIERAGISKGTVHEGVGVSSKHTLALIHRGDGTTAQLVTLARRIRDRVVETFGVRLHPEPNLVGVSLDP